MDVWNEIEALKERMDEAESALVHVPLEAGGGCGSTEEYEIETYSTFPAIPAEPTWIWCKGMMCFSNTGETVWTPTGKFTDETGEVGT